MHDICLKLASNRKKIIELFQTIVTITDICFDFQNLIIFDAGYNYSRTNPTNVQSLIYVFEILHKQ